MKRLMRLRSSSFLRDLCSDTEFSRKQLIQPLFAVEGISETEPIPGLRGNVRLPIEDLIRQVGADLESGVTHFILFPVPAAKGDSGFSHDFASKAISALSKEYGEDMHLWVDTCLCSYTSHGHCGVMDQQGTIQLEATLSELSNAAVTYVEAGAKGISPSDMMDGRTQAIRQSLDAKGFETVPVMSYSTKFASNFYGPFRHAADSAPQFGDRRAYQIDIRSRNDSLEASRRCAEEGADLLMVKPGMTAIDLVRPIQETTGRLVGAYQVSGEYAALSLLDEHGLIQFEEALLETWHVFRRAGCAYVITYGARYAKELGF